MTRVFLGFGDYFLKCYKTRGGQERDAGVNRHNRHNRRPLEIGPRVPVGDRTSVHTIGPAVTTSTDSSKKNKNRNK